MTEPKTLEDSIKLYKEYIDEHRNNVLKVWEKIKPLLNETVNDRYFINLLESKILAHDMSKYNKLEFEGYRKKFFPSEGEELDPLDFNLAWDSHVSNNDHHWQHWVRVGHTTPIPLPMPKICTLEMLVDWAAMSIKFNNKVQDWYKDNKDTMLLHCTTKVLIDKYINLF